METENMQSLRAQLLAAESVDPDRLRALHEQLAIMSENRLTPGKRIWRTIGLAAAVPFSGLGACVAIAAPIDLYLRIVWWLYTVGNLFVAAFAVMLLRRGRAEPRLFFGFGIVIATLAIGCLVALLCRAASSPGVEAILGVGFGGLCVLIDLNLLLYGRIAGAGLAIQEHLLRLELLLLDSKDQRR